MPNPATTSDVEARWRPLSERETTNAQAYLDDAWDMLTSRRRTLEADIAAGTVREATVIRVLAEMVRRILTNPDGKQSESIDDYKYTRNELHSSGLLSVSPDELGDITPGRRVRRSVLLVKDGQFPEGYV